MDSRALISMLFFSLLSTGFSTEVKAHGDTSAAFGQNASFFCYLSNPAGVSQVTWQKLRKNGVVDDLATYSTRFGKNEMKPNVKFLEALLNSTSIIVNNVSTADEGCYFCTFHVYPSGSVRKETCLTVHGISNVSTKLILSNKETPQAGDVVSCSVTGKPAPKVTWSRPDWQANESVVSNEDGTATVSINWTLSTEDLEDKYVDCVIGSRLERIYFSNNTDTGETLKDRHHLVVAGVLPILVIVVLLALFIVYRHVAKRQKGCARGFIERSCCYSVVSSEGECPVAERCLPSSACLAV
nr:OX-2 membrane glycoprotein-like [Paramormyrops kingsleyae]